ncbi:hypothetical protein [Streptomyces sp. TRM75563]|uniref:hypothetical protein n=1 Tax=Streptomyces sp. TRM75563 TaxID=2817418 RepID=UPI001F60E00F|nr:hypothetical protein [Streptomyces sp. TRM75563]MCI4045460.1 hypothetical protein [Streptomyces sp. TRM75563]
MTLFLLGLALGALSGVGTYAYTGAGGLAAAVGIIAAVLTWCGIATLAVLND